MSDKYNNADFKKYGSNLSLLIMSLDQIHSFFDDLLSNDISRGFLRILSNSGAYMLFLRKGSTFHLLTKNGYSDPSFSYGFFEDNPEILAPVLKKGYSQLLSKEISRPGRFLWAAVDKLSQPEYLLIAELEEDTSFLGPFLRVILSLELIFKQKPANVEKSHIDLPVWLQDILPELLRKNSPVLIVAEAGSGKEELVQAFLRQSYGDLGAAIFFHPGRLSQAVQLRELFGDPAGIRLGGASSSIAIVNRKEPVVVIQETGDLSSLSQLRLLALFSENREQKLWIFETSRDLKQMTTADRFLPALNDMLWKNAIVLPPLRNCLKRLREEIERLMHVFCKQYRRNVRLDSEAIGALSSYSWPGNWRELKNTLESSFLMATESVIYKKDLRLGRWSAPEDWDDLNLRKHSEAIEKSLLLRAYSMHAGNQVQMARALGISRGSLQYKLDKHGLN